MCWWKFTQKRNFQLSFNYFKHSRLSQQWCSSSRDKILVYTSKSSHPIYKSKIDAFNWKLKACCLLHIRLKYSIIWWWSVHVRFWCFIIWVLPFCVKKAIYVWSNVQCNEKNQTKRIAEINWFELLTSYNST